MRSYYIWIVLEVFAVLYGLFASKQIKLQRNAGQNQIPDVIMIFTKLRKIMHNIFKAINTIQDFIFL